MAQKFHRRCPLELCMSSGPMVVKYCPRYSCAATGAAQTLNPRRAARIRDIMSLRSKEEYEHPDELCHAARMHATGRMARGRAAAILPNIDACARAAYPWAKGDAA